MSANDDWSDWYDANRALLEDAYLAGEHPWQQSGFGLHSVRTTEDWAALRRPIMDCLLTTLPPARLAQPLHFLDIGCANGYLLECCVAWGAEDGATIIPWGLDISERLVALARERLPAYAACIFSGNAWNWRPPRRLDAVRTELVYIPAPLRQRFVERLLSEIVAEDGTLLVTEYVGHTPDGETTTLTIDTALRDWGYAIAAVRSGTLAGVERARIAAIRNA